jgi:hypothetical protein
MNFVLRFHQRVHWRSSAQSSLSWSRYSARWGRLQRFEAQFGAHTLPPQATAAQIQNFEQAGGQLREKIQVQTALLENLKKQGKETPRKAPLKDLPPPNAIGNSARRVSTSSIRSK